MLAVFSCYYDPVGRCVDVSVCVVFFFFFSSRRRHTRSDRDWSSDVCSSDLVGIVGRLTEIKNHRLFLEAAALFKRKRAQEASVEGDLRDAGDAAGVVGARGDRESGVEGKRVDLGGRRII